MLTVKDSLSFNLWFFQLRPFPVSLINSSMKVKSSSWFIAAQEMEWALPNSTSFATTKLKLWSVSNLTEEWNSEGTPLRPGIQLILLSMTRMHLYSQLHFRSSLTLCKFKQEVQYSHIRRTVHHSEGLWVGKVTIFPFKALISTNVALRLVALINWEKGWSIIHHKPSLIWQQQRSLLWKKSRFSKL